MLKHNFSESVASLEEAINRGLDRLSEYGIQVGAHRRVFPHPVAHADSGVSPDPDADQTAKALAIAAGVTVGLAAGLILVGFLHSRRRRH